MTEGNMDDVLAEALTDEQREAVRDTSKNVLALACAGSGKSRTLAYRIARLIAEGVDPEGIVAFTFTEKAADSIQHRVAVALRHAGLEPTIIGRLYIGTIHAYCKSVLGRLDASFRQYDVLDTNRFKLYLMSRYPQLGLHLIRRQRSARYFQTINNVVEAFVTANEECIPLTDVEAEDPDLGELLIDIRESILNDRFIDFSLMVGMVVEALEQGSGRALEIVEQVDHLLVDEYQDSNPLQERLIQAFHPHLESLFVVGDDDQAIYGWRGADVNNILTFQDRYEEVGVHRLSHNFRSTEPIVEVAESFVAAVLGASRLTKDPSAENAPGPRDMRAITFDTRPDEADWVVSQIEALLETKYVEDDGVERGLTPGDIAVLMRSTRQPEQTGEPRHAPFTSRLADADIPYTIEAGGGVFDRPQVEAIRQTFELLRDGNPTRESARSHFDAEVLPAYPEARFDAFVDVISNWGRLIHTPIQVQRRRIYPQQLLQELLAAFSLPGSDFDEGVMSDIGVFSRILQDVEAVYVSIDSARRFQEVLNFLSNVAEYGYDTSTDALVQRPDAVTVATVHKMKGLEFPVVFVVDAEHRRFPRDRSGYRGWMPDELMQPAIARGAYISDRPQEARLFYTAITRAERFLYITCAKNLPAAKRERKQSPFTARLSHAELADAPGLPDGLEHAEGARRIDETIVPTTYSEIRYFLRCPRDFKFRHGWGFSPPITEMFGFGQTVHAAVGKLHERFGDSAPNEDDAAEVADSVFHLKHVPPSRDPEERPGAYEQAQDSARGILRRYASEYSSDFSRQRQVEITFEVPVDQAVISGAIDLLLHVDPNGDIVSAEVIDFKTMEGGPEPVSNERLDWTELALQVQLYAKAARQVLGEPAHTGAVHLLKDGQRVNVPVDDDAVEAAIRNVEWAVDRVIADEFPMRPHEDKCQACDWELLCPQVREDFTTGEVPPILHLPDPAEPRRARAFSQVTPTDT